MRAAKWTRVLAAVVIAGVCSLPAPASAQGRGIGRGRATAPGQVKKQQDRNEYNRGYQQGLREGEQDARRNRPFEAYPDRDNRGSRDGDYRNGFADGYRIGYNQIRRDDRRNSGVGGIFLPRDDRRDGAIIRDGGGARRAPGGYQEPALARGYSDGYQRGVDDGRDRRRYDPVGEKDYREADQGYYGGYGSKDAYKNNYRAGFRQGYEDGYRDGNNRR
jgi:hypothetical protein